MPAERRPTKPGRATEPPQRASPWFWVNVVLITTVHVVLLAFTLSWTRSCSPAAGIAGGGDSGFNELDDVTWVDPAVFTPVSAQMAESVASEEPAEAPPPEETIPDPPVSLQKPDLVKSELEVPAERPTPTPTPSPSPKPSPSPSPKPKPKPSPSPKPKASPSPKKEKKKEPEAKKKTASSKTKKDETAKKAVESPKTKSTPTEKPDTKKAAFLAARSGTGGGAGSNAGGGSGSGGDGEAMAGYHRHIQERFHREWIQPTSVFTTASRFVTTVEITIDKSGRIVSVRQVRSSGNPVVDESVMLAARNVVQINPLPSAAPKVPYTVSIDFELK